MAKKSRFYFLKKAGKVNPEEERICNEIDSILSRATDTNNEDVLSLINQNDTCTDADSLLSLRDAMRDMESITKTDTSYSERTTNSFSNMSDEKTTANIEELGDLDAVPTTTEAPQVVEQVKERIYNTVDNGGNGKPYVPLAEDNDAHMSGPSSNVDPENLPPGVRPDAPNLGGAPIGGSTFAGAAPTSNGGFAPPPPKANIPPAPLNPAFNEMENKDKKQAAEQLVDVSLGAYERAHRLLQMIVEVPEDKLVEMQIEGKIDLSMTVPISDTQEMPLMDWVKNFNTQSKDSLAYDSSFGDSVRPAMIRVFMKYGWGLSDEQWLAWKFGEDIATKLSMCYGLKKSINRTLELFSKMHMAQNKPIEQAAPKQSEPVKQQEAAPDFSGASNFKTSEVVKDVEFEDITKD